MRLTTTPVTKKMDPPKNEPGPNTSTKNGPGPNTSKSLDPLVQILQDSTEVFGPPLKYLDPLCNKDSTEVFGPPLKYLDPLCNKLTCADISIITWYLDFFTLCLLQKHFQNGPQSKYFYFRVVLVFGPPLQ